MPIWARICSRMLWILRLRHCRNTILRRWARSLSRSRTNPNTRRVVASLSIFVSTVKSREYHSRSWNVPFHLSRVTSGLDTFLGGGVVDPASTVLHGRTPHSTSPSPLVFSHACSILSHQQDVAAYIKKEFDKKHSPTWWDILSHHYSPQILNWQWLTARLRFVVHVNPPMFVDYHLKLERHVIVGRNFGSYVTHETKHFIYFYLGQVAVLLFKSGWCRLSEVTSDELVNEKVWRKGGIIHADHFPVHVNRIHATERYLDQT